MIDPLMGVVVFPWEKRDSPRPWFPTSDPRLAQAQSSRGRRGRKMDFPEAERLVKRRLSVEYANGNRSRASRG
jgi:hypothetical protein